jgi:fatty-acyl-CoA synthase
VGGLTSFPPAFGWEPLTPLAFLARSSAVYSERVALVDGDRAMTYAELAERCHRLAGALISLGIEPGDRVSVLSPSTGICLEAHFGVPLAGAVLNALNTRLSALELGYIVNHAGSRVLLVHDSLRDLADHLVTACEAPVRMVVGGSGRVDDEYECMLADALPASVPVADEWGLLSLNYTSGTTGQPKGVMYAHRGAYLQSLAMVAQAGLDASSVFLWTLPMFHCNGWCFPWAVTAVGGRHVALPKVDPGEIWKLVQEAGVTHFNAAPTVLTNLASHPDARPAHKPLQVATGGAPPSPALLGRLADLNVEVTHLYGLTETYGPAVICDWWPEWNHLGSGEQARMKARQGVANLVSQPLRVIDQERRDVPADGTTIGEVVLRGNNIMLGYYRDMEATTRASVAGPGGPWFRTGDLGVMHPDGYLELRDRLKDIIVSGGENIASIEVEQVLDSHPAVLESAVIGVPDEHWGEVPVAFVTLKTGATTSQAELIDYVKARIARFKAPKRIQFGDLPKTGTGKIQKFVLRDRVR